MPSHGAQQFAATVQNTPNASVTWAVDGVANGDSAVGTITGTGAAVIYTAPGTEGPHTVTATSTVDATTSASASVTVTAAAAATGPAVTISPSTATLTLNTTQQFTATVKNTTNTGVSWTVDGILNGNATVGTITGTGDSVTYTAPATSGFHTLTVTSLADMAKSASATISVTQATSGFPSSKHVFIVMEENQNFSQVFPSGSAANCPSSGMPYLCGLAAANGLATNFYSNQHGSLLAYLYDTSGSAWTSSPYDCTGSNCASVGVITGDNIVRALSAAGKSWRGYFEDMPSQGYIGGDVANYVQHHNPFIWYSDVAASPAEQAKMYPFTQFAQDLQASAFPDFSYIVPNVLHDADGTGTQTSANLLSAADSWLQSNIGPLFATPVFQPGGDGILIVVFDEANVSGKSGDSTTDSSCSPTQPSGCGGRVAFVMIGPNVIPGSTTATVYHFQDMLHTVIHLLGLGDYMNNSAGAADIALFQ